MQSGDWKSFLQAAIDGDLQQVKYYLDSGADPNYFHPEIMTNPMIEAARLAHLEMVKLLLKYGADPKRMSQMGESAMSIAKNQKNRELIDILRK